MRAIRNRVLILPLLLLLSACQTWHRRPLPEPGPAQVPSPARVTLADQRSVVVWHAAVEGDSLIGLTGVRAGERSRFAVPMEQVRRVEARGTDFHTSLAIAIALAAAIVLGLRHIAATSDW